MSRKRGFDDMENDTSLQWFAKATGSDIVEGVRGKGSKGSELINIVALT